MLRKTLFMSAVLGVCTWFVYTGGWKGIFYAFFYTPQTMSVYDTGGSMRMLVR